MLTLKNLALFSISLIFCTTFSFCGIFNYCGTSKDLTETRSFGLLNESDSPITVKLFENIEGLRSTLESCQKYNSLSSENQGKIKDFFKQNENGIFSIVVKVLGFGHPCVTQAMKDKEVCEKRDGYVRCYVAWIVTLTNCK